MLAHCAGEVVMASALQRTFDFVPPTTKEPSKGFWKGSVARGFFPTAPQGNPDLQESRRQALMGIVVV